MFATGPRAVSADDQDWFAVEWDDGGGESDNAPHLDQNVLRPATPRVAPASILVSRVASFPPPDGLVSGPPPYLAQTWHSKIGIRDECRK